jgi:ABC-type antimicrobial peptide transport system permease subunit
MGWDGTNWRRIVGVVDDIEDLAISESSPLTFYMPVEGGLPTVTFLVRLESAAMAPPADEIRQAIGAVDPSLPVPVLESLDAGAGRSVAAPRFTLAIVSIFASVAFVIAIMGVYGVTLYSVQQRTREIGVRLALGARPAAVVRLILGRVAAIAAVGVVTGLVLAGALSGVLDALLFRTSPRDPVVLAAAAVLAGGAALVATWLPARRAARVDPTTAIK